MWRLFYFSMYLLWKKFNLNWNQSGWDGKSDTFTLRKKKLRNWGLISHKCLIYRRQKLISWLMNIHQESPPTLKPMNLLLGLCLDPPHFAFLAHNKYSPPQAFNRLACSLLQHAFLILQFFCYFWIKSVSGNLSLP